MYFTSVGQLKHYLLTKYHGVRATTKDTTGENIINLSSLLTDDNSTLISTVLPLVKHYGTEFVIRIHDKEKIRKTQIRKSCESNWKKQSDETLGAGKFGVVSIACKIGTDDCNYVLKVQDANRLFRNEVEIFHILNTYEEAHKVRLIPKLYDSWVCKGLGYIIMEKLDGSLQGAKDRKELLTKINDQVTEIRQYMLMAGVLFINWHLGNILYKKVASERYKFFVTDLDCQ